MKRQLALLLAITLLAGCRTPTAAIDPFVGTYTVPPPGTSHSSVAPPPSSYYSSPPPGATSSNAPNGYAPPGNDYGYSRSAAEQSAPRASLGSTANNRLDSQALSIPVRTTNPSERPAATSNAGDRRPPPSSGFQVNNNPPIRVVEPLTTAADLRSTPASNRAGFTPRTPAGQSAAPPQTDIMDLPARRAEERRVPASNSSGFRPVSHAVRASYEEEVRTDDAAGTDAAGQDRRVTRRAVPISHQSQRSYGYDANYAWLQGKLEYSRVDRRWKLRYIPIDGDTDAFGGSVILRGAQLLEEFEPGQFVTVYGALGEEDTAAGSYSPAYQIDRIEPVAE